MDIDIDEPNYTSDHDMEDGNEELTDHPVPSVLPSITPKEAPEPALRAGAFLQNLRNLAIAANKKKRAATQKPMIGGATAFIDQDESGNYDPAKEHKSARRKKPKRPRIGEVFSDDEENVPKKKGARMRGFDGMITLTLRSKKGLDYLRQITPGPYSDFEESEEESESEDDDSNAGRKRRARAAKEKGPEIPPRDDGLTLEQLTIGHPQRRGCRVCFLSGSDDCTLIDDGHTYPCEACEDAEIDCELIVPPKLKQDCERCKAKRVKCSYRRGKGKGKTTCSNCATEGVACVAGPAKETTRRMDDVLSHTTPEREGMVAPRSPSPTPEPVRPRRFKACNQCRNSGKTCSLRTFEDPGPCSSCKKAQQHCQFVMIPPSQMPAYEKEMAELRFGQKNKHGKATGRKVGRSPKRAKRDDGAAYSSEANTHKLYSEVENRIVKRAKKLDGKSFHMVGYTGGNRHITIDTHFCHPIKFNYEPDPINSDPCSWCDDPLYGVHGLGPAYNCDTKRVEGFYDPRGKGFEEVMGGFAELGATQTKMCVYCTFARIKILSCEVHTVRKITDKEMDGWVYSYKKFKASAEMWAEDKDAEGAQYFLDAKWCAICPAFASHKCASPGGDEHEHGDEGCGLLLCEGSAEMVEKLVRGGVVEGRKMLDTLIREVKAQKWQFELGLRADSVFLTSGGELWERFMKNFSAGSGEGDEGEGEGSAGLEQEVTSRHAEAMERKKKDKQLLLRAQKKQREIDENGYSHLKDWKGKGKQFDSLGDVKLGGIVEPRREQVAMAFGESIIDLTED